MKSKPAKSAAALRRAALARQKKQATQRPPTKIADWRQLQQELEVHQIELEMQNAELQEAHVQLETAVARYTDLYEFAPVGYFMLSPEGVIAEANLTGALLLGTERARLVGRRLALWIAVGDQVRFCEFLRQVFGDQAKAWCEVALRPQKDTPILQVRIEGTPAGDGPTCRAIVTDITLRYRAEEVARAAQAETQRLLAVSEQSRRALLSVVEDEQATARELKTSEARLRTAVMSAPFPIMLHAEDGEVLMINAVWTEITGFTHADIPTIAAWSEKAYGDRQDSVRAHIATLYRLDQKQDEGEFAVRTKSGETRYWVWGSAPLGKLPDGRRMVISMASDVTASKQATENLRLRDRVINAAAEGICITSPVEDGGKLIYVNQGFEQMTGYRADEVLGRNMRFLQGTATAPADVDQIRAATQAGAPCHVTLLNYRKDGTPFWNQLSITPVRDEAGVLTQFVAILNDVTGRKQAEEELRRSEQRLQQAQSIGAIGDWEFEAGTGQINWSPELYRLYGRDPAQGPPNWEENLTCYFPEDALRLRDCVQRAIATGKSYTLDLHVRLPDGREAYHYAVGHALKDRQGKVVKLYGVAQDITGRKRAEEELRNSEEHYRKLADNFPGGTVNTYDRDLRMTFVAGGDMKKFGVTAEMFLGKHFTEVAPPETWAIAEPYLRAAFQGETVTYETPYFDNRFYRVTVAPLYAADGTIEEIMVVSQNITEHKLAEEHLARISRLYLVLSRVNETIVRTKDRQKLFEAVCRIAVENGLFRMAAVMMVEDVSQTVRAVAHAGVEEGFFSEVSVIMSEPRLTRGTVGTAIRTGRPDACNDTVNDPRMAPWRESLAKHGFLSTASFPIQIMEKTIGVLVLFADEVDYFEKDELKLLVSVTKDISFACDSFEKEQRRREADKLVRVNQERLRRSQAVGRVGSWEYDLKSEKLWGSDEAFRLFGLADPDKEVSVNEVEACIPDRVRVHQALVDLVTHGARYDLEYEIRPADGSPPRIVNSIGELLRDEQGNPMKVIGVIQDITEGKRAQEELRQSQQQLRALSGRLETLREDERTRIAREIHDELGQMLTGIKMDLRSVEHSLEKFGKDRRVNPILDKLVATAELTDATVKTVQRIAAELRPGILDKLGLATALEYEAAQFEKRAGLKCQVKLAEIIPPLRPDVATALFRIFQEVLTNVIRHAHATAVEAEFRVAANVCRLEVRDNGRGITPADIAKPTALGLLGMQERARLVGGEVSFGARPGGGTVVTVEIPNRSTTQENL